MIFGVITHYKKELTCKSLQLTGRPRKEQTMINTRPEEMTAQHYAQLIDLLNEKISRLERENDSKRKEINRLQRENSELKKKIAT
jgi:peptidoglycan hydrolase CwlO-like protein